MKNALLLGLTLLCINFSNLRAQQDPQFSQNMFNKLFPNPAFAGSTGSLCGSLLARHQWMGFEGRPETYQISAHAPVPLLYGGVGAVIYQDQLGQEKTFGAKVSYAYRRSLGPGQVAVGVSLGMINKQIGNNWRAIDNPNQDILIPVNGASKTGFDMDLGLYYNLDDRLYVGISTMHLPASQLTSTDFEFDVARHYYIMGGYSHNLTSDIKIKPSVFIKTDASSTQLDLNTIAVWKSLFWGGLSYRLEDAVVPMIGFQKDIGSGIAKIGYSYDITTSQLRRYSSGTNEIMLSFCMKPKPVIPIKVKTVRFL